MATRQPPPSRWWYGVAALPVAIGFLALYLLASSLLLTQPIQAESLMKQGIWMVALVLLAGFWSGFLVVASGLIQLLFPIFLVMDIRAIRRSERSWTPSWAYSLIAIPSVALLLSSDPWSPQLPTLSENPHPLILYPLVFIAPLGYLYQRRRYVGVPFGKRQGTEPSGSTQSDSEDEARVTDHAGQISRWWYGVVLPPALSVLGQFGQVSSALWVVLVIVAIFLIPLFALSLFLDARAIAKSEQSWNPNPFVWGILGLVPLTPLFLGVLTYLNSALMVPLALLYLYRRNQHVGFR